MQGKKIPKKTWDQFLKLLSENTSSVTGTANQLNITARSFYNHCYEDPEFLKAVRKIFDGIRTTFAEDALFALIADKNLGAIRYYLSRRGGKRWNYDQIVKQIMEFELDVKRKQLKDGTRVNPNKRPSAAMRIGVKAYEQALFHGYDKVPPQMLIKFYDEDALPSKRDPDKPAFDA